MSDNEEFSLLGEIREPPHSRRIKSLTEKAMEQYKHRVSEFKRGLDAIKDQISQVITINESVSDETSFFTLSELVVSINAQCERYNRLFNDFMLFLTRTCTAENNIESIDQSSEDSKFKGVIDSFSGKVYQLRERKVHVAQADYVQQKPPSIKSKSSSRSRASSGSMHSSVSHSTLARKQAKAEAAKAQIVFMEREAEIKRQQSEIEEKEMIATAARTRQKTDFETELKLLQEKKHVAAATAEAEALEHSLGGSCHSQASLKSIPRSDPHVRTAEFVKTQIHEFTFNPDVPAFPPVIEMPSTTVAETSQNVSSHLLPHLEIQQKVTESPLVKTPCPRPQGENNIANDLTRFLLRKDLAMSRLSKFNDKPENYQSWKASFSDVAKEMGVSPSEEFDLLVKWLGSESQMHAISLRSAYYRDPTKGLEKIWERLNERYGAAESVHHSVMTKLETFQKLTSKEPTKLYELSDILTEIEALKLDPKYAVTLSYFDSSVGIAPIIQKVPFLQEKWARKATDYKSKFGVPFPPFSVFCTFVNDQAKFRNDPGLPLFPSQIQTERKHFSKGQIFSNKTEIHRPDVISPGRCPIHKTEHSLDECRTFRSKSFDQRRELLRQNNLCFRCMSAVHQARECTTNVRCDVCSSETHCTTMHLNKQSQSYSSSPKTMPNGEEKVNSSCTEICGRKVNGKSCAKLVLVKIYQQHDPTRQVKAYAIIDEQSNRSLAKPELFTQLGIDGNSYEYTMNSCSGSFVTQGRRASGCIVEAIDGTTSHNLPTLIECAEIPNNRDEIPTPLAVRHHTHLSDLEDRIPELDDEAEILLLIGRDMTEAHHVLEQRLGPPNSPYAKRLRLGWVVVGEVCLGKVHRPERVTVNKTHLIFDGRESLLPPCQSVFQVKEHVGNVHSTDGAIFTRTQYDEKIGLSIEDQEIRPSVGAYLTEVKEAATLGVKRFERFSIWSKLVVAISCLIHIRRSFSGQRVCIGWHACSEAKTPAIQEQARRMVISAYQQESFPDEKRDLTQKGYVSNDSPLSSLDPFIDANGLIRVGGRLSRAALPLSEKNPVIISKHSHIAMLLIRHFHAQVQHQGRHLTEGAVRANGYWIIGCKAIISSIIQNCVKCKRLRGSRECQKMADLPAARLNPSPPFSFVGVDTFGPWEVSARKTRDGHANSKRWALMFTCLSIRAVHIEVIEPLSASCFINAFRRFIAMRGEVKEVCSACGTNFVGAANEMGIDSINVGDTSVKQFLTEKSITWNFNPPHASHIGGAWERMIGVTRRILDSMMLDLHQTLTHEILTTLMAEVSAIINARPLVPVSTDPSRPELLTPAALLTQKTSRPHYIEYLPVDLKTQWKQVQALADRFWKRWRVENLQTLQTRRKWKGERANLKVGYVVLMRDKEAHRNEWPMGLVVRVFPGEDDRVRKVEVKTAREGKTSTFIRPVTELVILLPSNDQ